VYAGILLGTGPQVDPGFSGKLSCPLYDLTNVDILITRGEDFATIDFEKTTELLAAQPTWEEKKAKIDKAKDKEIVSVAGEAWSFYRLPPMKPLNWTKPYKIVSSLIEMRDEVKTWRRLGVGAVIAFFGLTLSLLSFGANIYRQNTEMSRQLADYKNELEKATQRVSNVEKDLDRFSRTATQSSPPAVVRDSAPHKVGSH
jgi:hypothetical protein